MLALEAQFRDNEEIVREIINGVEVSKQAAIEQKVGRNDPCPCGSGKKFKKCCA